jgi:hypothetical protein
MDEIDEVQGEKIRTLQNMYSLLKQPYLAARPDAIQKIHKDSVLVQNGKV